MLTGGEGRLLCQRTDIQGGLSIVRTYSSIYTFLYTNARGGEVITVTKTKTMATMIMRWRTDMTDKQGGLCVSTHPLIKQHF